MKFKKLATDSMYYVLLAIHKEIGSGIETIEYIKKFSKGQIILGPGTLYSILDELKNRGLIVYNNGDDTLKLTQRGNLFYASEMDRYIETRGLKTHER